MKKSLWFISSLLLVTSCTKSPTGRSQFMMIAESEMVSLGAQSYQEIKNREKINTDPKINSYVQCVTNKLLAVTPAQAEFNQWEVTVFDSPQINAFALPGGKIGVYTGLLKIARTEDQLAAVIGHEIGHVIAKHGNERLSRSMATNGILQLAKLALNASGSEYSELIMAGLGIGVNVGVTLPFSRSHESESDLIGLELMHAAGFDVQQSVRLWQNMQKASADNTPEFLSTHPAATTRIQELRKAISLLPSQKNQAQACQTLS